MREGPFIPGSDYGRAFTPEAVTGMGFRWESRVHSIERERVLIFDFSGLLVEAVDRETVSMERFKPARPVLSTALKRTR